MTTLRLARLTAGSLVIVSASLWTSAAGQEITQVTPDNGAITVGTNLTNQKAIFTVQSQSMQSQTRQIFVSCSGQVTSCITASFKTFVYATPDTVFFSTTGAGTGGIVLTAQGSISSDQGSYVVTVSPPYGVAVTPDGSTAPNRFPNTAYAESFTVKNTGTSQDTFALTCIGSSNINCGLLSPTGPIPLAPNVQQGVTVNYTTGAPGSGLLTLRAASTHSSDSGSYTVPVLRSAAVRPELSERQQFWHTRSSQRFFVKNLQPQTATYNLSTVCNGSAATCSVAPTSLTLAFGESGIATVSDTAVSTGAGSVTLNAIDASVSSLRDSGSLALTVDSAPKPVVSLVTTNPGTTVERDQCLTIAAGQNAAFECGDLRIVHALPAIRTLNKARVPTLLYNSADAQPHPVFTALVTVTTVPDSVEAILKVNGVEQTRARWAGTDWKADSTRQIALAYTDTAATSVRDYTLDVATIYLPSGYYLTSTAGKFVLINRAHSPFGAGWWLAGLERLFILPDSNRLWVGGDGSARLYTSAGSDVWVASDLDRPDTLRRTNSRYSRRLPGGVIVGFNAAGLHDSTVNRLGHRTGFGYDTVSQVVRLRTIKLPPDTTLKYTFNYDANNKLASVTAPGGRTATIFVSSERVDSIRDADSRATKFSYDSLSSRRISGRTDRRGTLTNYRYDAAAKLSRVILRSLNADSIRAGFRSRETVGLATATPKTATDTANVYTSFFGARQFTPGPDSIGQETRFWLDRYGAPRRTVDALGHQTVIKHEEGQWPALATEIVAANGFTTRAGYDGHGNVVRSTAVQPLGPGQDDTTRYHWDLRWDFVDSIVTPSGVTTTMAYDTSTGNRLWQQIGSDAARRDTFRYNNSFKLLSATLLPQTPADSIDYDVRGNVAATRTPKGFWTSYYKDALGRDTLVVTPIDSTDKAHGSALDSTSRLRQRVVYTVLDQDSLTESIAPPNRAQTVRVTKLHDAGGNLTSLARVGLPDTFGVGTITTQWRYDVANRRTVEVAADGQVDSTDYDPAGNAVVLVTRRKQPISGTHLTIRMRYDALNRLVQRVTDSVAYPRDSLGVAIYMSRSPSLNRGFPYYPNNPQNGYTVFADTARFAYTILGGDSAADNRDALVRRSYYPNGALQAETLNVRTLAELGAGGTFDLHTYVTTYRYDRDGRRTVLKYPTQLAPSLKDSTRFTYDATTGALADVWDPLENHFTYHYNLRGEMDTLRYASAPGGVFEARAYNEDGALVRHIVSGNRRDASFKYDARQKVRWSGNQFGTKDTLTAAYSGLGYLLNSRLKGWGQTLSGDTGTALAIDTLSYDALGNLIRTHSIQTRTSFQWHGSTTDSSSTNRLNYYAAGTGRLNSVDDYVKSNVDTLVYDSAGSTKQMWQKLVGRGGLENRLTYYGADGSARAADYRRFDGDPTISPNPNRFVFEEYRYDAYGRRVWVRARRDCDGMNPSPDPRPRGECRTDLVRRTVWDGFQELVEIQQPGGDADSVENDLTPLHRGYPDGIDQNPFNGRVLYTYGAVLDQPLSLVRVGYADTIASTPTPQPWFMWQPFSILPLWNYLGEVDRSLVGAGAPLCQVVSGVERCVLGEWPFAWTALQISGFAPYFWHGTVTENKRDKAQTLYRRYRLYDPLTGRFTQEDPIGLAGGLNLYGFAAGDPVNFSDPYGLRPCQNALCPILWLLRFRAWHQAWIDRQDAWFAKQAGMSVEAYRQQTDMAMAWAMGSVGEAPARFPRFAGPMSAASRLSMQLASEEALAAAQAGRGIAIAGAGARSGRLIDDIARITSTYGGEAADWAKMSTGRTVNGVRVEVHWYENVRTNQRVEIKTPWDH